MNIMEVTKRNGKTQELLIDKITKRIQYLCTNEEKKKLDIHHIVIKTCSDIYNKIKTSELDTLTANICGTLGTVNPLYINLAAKISISNLHKETDDDYQIILNKLYNSEIKYISDTTYKFACDNITIIQKNLNYLNDYNITYFGLKTLERSYLIKINNAIVERPQHMLMRVSLGMHTDINKVIETYHAMSNKKFIHASPTLFNSGTIRPQLSSCFLMGTDDDLDTMYRTTIADCASISKHSGGIGIHIGNLRSNGSIIKGVNGSSKGIIPYIKTMEATANHVDQGGKRMGSIAVYLSSDHADLLYFIELRKQTGDEKKRARDIFLSMWISDLFMKAVEENDDWYLMCPNESPNLQDTYGEEYNILYKKYVDEGKYKLKLKARNIWNKILESQIETGMPYICYKDNINNKSNQKNYGVIKSSNLCAEITEYSDHKETAVCNLASIAVNNFIEPKNITNKFIVYSKSGCENCHVVKMLLRQYNLNYEIKILDNKNDRNKLYQKIDEKFDILVNSMPLIFLDNDDNYLGGYVEFEDYIRPTYNFNELKEISKQVCYNLNNIIDINYYPTERCKISNFRHRPIGIGIQGLSDAYILMRYPFYSEKANILNKEIMETIYYGALEQSMELAIEKGYYESFPESPFSQGILQFDMWNVTPSNRWDWDTLKLKIKEHGTRNSLVTALMPTASTSQILGNNECFEAYTRNLYTRKTNAGEYTIINKHLYNDLIYLDLWIDEIKNKLIQNYGSIQNINNIPQIIKNLYKTVWEIPQKVIVDQAIARGPYVDQSQSMNIYMATPNMTRLHKSHFYGWKNGLKTGMYYLHSKPAANPIQFTINNNCESCSG